MNCRILQVFFVWMLVAFVAQAFPVSGMEFSWVTRDPTKTMFQEVDGLMEPVNYERIEMRGPINRGDSVRFTNFLSKHFAKYKKEDGVPILLSSDAGDLMEALKLGEIVRSLFGEVRVDSKCVSACFFIYISAVERWAPERSIGIHRAYFDAKLYSNLSVAEIRDLQSQLSRLVDSILEKNSVPKTIVDRLNSTSSGEIYWLSSDEVDLLGKYPDWFEEILIGKCGLDV